MTRRLRIFTFLPVIVFLVLILSGQVLAIDRYVDNTPGCSGNSPCYSTIQAAIDAAGTGDTVRVANGTYTGSGNRNIDFKGKAVTVQSDGGPTNCIIDCEDLDRGFYFHSGEGANSVLSGFTITNGRANFGGGIYFNSASPTIINCVLESNTAVRYGGGIYCTSTSSPNISDCTISYNTAVGISGSYGGGGGVYSEDSTPNISDSSINNNTALIGGGVYGDDSVFSITSCIISSNIASDRGGGVYLFFNLNPLDQSTISGSTISDNDAYDGGGIYCASSSPIVYTTTISGNTADRRAGGIYCDDSSASFSTCIIDSNSAQFEGGIRISGGSDSFFGNCIISNNTADYGGGIGISTSSPDFDNCTVTKNIAATDGGGLRLIGSTFQRPTFTNTLFWDDAPNEFNAFSDPILIEYCNIEGGYSGLGTGNINSNPNFADSANNDFHLTAVSGGIDAATSTGAPAVDFDGTARWDDPATPNNGGGAEPYYDIGAFEYYPWCECDFEPAEGDGDVDGADLAAYMADDGGVSVADFAEEFGRVDCP